MSNEQPDTASDNHPRNFPGKATSSSLAATCVKVRRNKRLAALFIGPTGIVKTVNPNAKETDPMAMSRGMAMYCAENSGELDRMSLCDHAQSALVALGDNCRTLEFLLNEYEGEMMIFNTSRSRALETAITQELQASYTILRRLIHHHLWQKGAALAVQCPQGIAFWVSENICANEEYVSYETIIEGVLQVLTEGLLLPQPFRLTAPTARLVASRVAEQLQELNTNDTERVSVYQWGMWVDSMRDSNSADNTAGVGVGTLMEPSVNSLEGKLHMCLISTTSNSDRNRNNSGENTGASVAEQEVGLGDTDPAESAGQTLLNQRSRSSSSSSSTPPAVHEHTVRVLVQLGALKDLYFNTGGDTRDETELIAAGSHSSSSSSSERGPGQLQASRGAVAQWADREGWLMSEQLWRYYGVELRGMSELTTLDLSNNRLVGPLPASIGRLAHLRCLYLQCNALTGALPAELCRGCQQLRKLCLSHNALGGELPQEIGQLQKLEYLHLQSNRLTGSIPSSIGQLRRLIMCLLDSNLLTGVLPSELRHCEGLEHFSASKNNLSGQLHADLFDKTKTLEEHDREAGGPSSFSPSSARSESRKQGKKDKNDKKDKSERGGGKQDQEQGQNAVERDTGPGLPNLLNLELHTNNLQGPLPHTLTSATKLEVLVLSGNELSGPLPHELGDMMRLRELHLSENQLTGTIPTSIGRLRHLQTFAAYINQLSGPVPPSLSYCQEMRDVQLWSNDLTGNVPVQLKKLKHLHTLHLQNNRLEGLEDLYDNLRHVESVFL